MREARKFGAFRIYYAGEKVDGLPLTGISEASHGRLGIEWNFSYGNCQLPSGLFAEGGCSLPLSVQNWSTCVRWANLFTRSRNPHGLFDPRRAKAAPNRRLFDFRGAKATGGEGGSELEIFTGRTTVVIWAHRRNVANFAAQTVARCPPGAASSASAASGPRLAAGQVALPGQARLTFPEWGGQDSNLRSTDYESRRKLSMEPNLA